MEISTLSDKVLMVVIIKMLTKLRRRMDKQNFNKESENIKENQTELKNTVTGIKKCTAKNQQQIRWQRGMEKRLSRGHHPN